MPLIGSVYTYSARPLFSASTIADARMMSRRMELMWRMIGLLEELQSEMEVSGDGVLAPGAMKPC